MESKKRKRKAERTPENEIDTSKPTALFEPSKGRTYTLSIAVPGSIILNAQTPELQSQLAGQIGRALAVFCVDEIVVFDDGTIPRESPWESGRENTYTGYSDPNYFLTHILAYLETPPHLRKALFPMHPNLRLAGTLPSLDMPHHLRRENWCKYREAVTVTASEKSTKGSSNQPNSGDASTEDMTRVETGLRQAVSIPAKIPANTRLTVKFDDSASANSTDEIIATAVAPSAPREEAGYYWGYSTRSASSLSDILTECPFDGGYDLTIGTSERGTSLSGLKSKKKAIPRFRHMMIIFGGVAGLEVAVKADKELEHMGVKIPEALFDHWVNLCPGQGSRTIRTEEAIWIGLMGLRDIVLKRGKR